MGSLAAHQNPFSHRMPTSPYYLFSTGAGAVVGVGFDGGAGADVVPGTGSSAGVADGAGAGASADRKPVLMWF